MAAISRAEVAHLARLSRLAVTDEELDDIPPTSHSVPLTNVLREDVVVPCLSREDALAGAPDSAEDRFRVPRILDEES
jgi:aspartyl-tRNA(Asn)/glutamyl-tRNA(Gln) amidotransferase subunit C